MLFNNLTNEFILISILFSFIACGEMKDPIIDNIDCQKNYGFNGQNTITIQQYLDWYKSKAGIAYCIDTEEIDDSLSFMKCCEDILGYKGSIWEPWIGYFKYKCINKQGKEYEFGLPEKMSCGIGHPPEDFYRKCYKFNK